MDRGRMGDALVRTVGMGEIADQRGTTAAAIILPGMIVANHCMTIAFGLSARIAMGERLLRELQFQAPPRASGGGTVLDALRGAGAHRAMATALQCGVTALVTRIPASSAGNDLAASIRSRLRCAPASPDAGR